MLLCRSRVQCLHSVVMYSRQSALNSCWKDVQTRSISKTLLQKDAIQIFNAGVEAVIPYKAVTRILKVRENTLQVENKLFRLNKNVYLIGFGKAVAGMAKAVEDVLSSHFVSGIISVPEGTANSNTRQFLPNRNGCIKVMEGAKNNLPDQNALKAAQEITKFVSQCPSDSLLIVLISGGGSALLPLPIPPVTLEEKQEVTKLLSKSGADILELNAIRKALSLIKGGGIVRFSNSCEVLALILSDIIGDKLEFIASGPTVPNTDDSEVPLKILKKYNLLECIPENVTKVLRNSFRTGDNTDFSRVQNALVGSNKIALEDSARESQNLGYSSLVLTTTLQGESRICGQDLASLAYFLYREFSSKPRNPNNDTDLQAIANGLGISSEKILEAVNLAKTAFTNGKGLCVLCGGETTVTVKGNGTGGRNQELALSFGIALNRQFGDEMPNIILLSAGTDGFDGPNDAAGAFGYPSLKFDSNAEDYLKNNDSYHFYEKLANGEYHFKTGHTGTNVMDIQVLLMKNETIE